MPASTSIAWSDLPVFSTMSRSQVRNSSVLACRASASPIAGRLTLLRRPTLRAFFVLSATRRLLFVSASTNSRVLTGFGESEGTSVVAGLRCPQMSGPNGRGVPLSAALRRRHTGRLELPCDLRVALAGRPVPGDPGEDRVGDERASPETDTS